MIRKICVEDATDVVRIITESLGYDTDGETVASQIIKLANDNHYLTLVWVDEDGVAVGFIHAMRYETLHRTGGFDIISLAVDEGRQGRGIGSALLRDIEDRARAMGASYVRLNSRVSREAAHAFYESRGYVADKLQKRFIKAL